MECSKSKHYQVNKSKKHGLSKGGWAKVLRELSRLFRELKVRFDVNVDGEGLRLPKNRL